jgi:hypothetical protein
MKNTILLLVVLLFVACEKESIFLDQVPVSKPVPITIDYHLFVGESRDSFLTYVSTPCTGDIINYKLIDSRGEHTVTVFFDNDSVVAYMYFSEMIARDSAYDNDFLDQVDLLYDYGESIGIEWDSLPKVNDMMISVSHPSLRVEDIASYQGETVKYKLRTCTYSSLQRSVIIQACKNGGDIVIGKKKSADEFLCACTGVFSVYAGSRMKMR